MELAVVVAVVAILAATSLIVFTNARKQYALTQNARNIVMQIERARSLAIKYNQTLTLGFTSSNKVFGLTCTSCTDPKKELPDYSLPSGITLSAYPTLTIKGNGTISSSSASVVVTDGQGYQVPISISNSGRTTVGDLSKAGLSY
jgi:type II secretory pathway pseudopilin PulG